MIFWWMSFPVKRSQKFPRNLPIRVNLIYFSESASWWSSIRWNILKEGYTYSLRLWLKVNDPPTCIFHQHLSPTLEQPQKWLARLNKLQVYQIQVQNVFERDFLFDGICKKLKFERIFDPAKIKFRCIKIWFWHVIIYIDQIFGQN